MYAVFAAIVKSTMERVDGSHAAVPIEMMTYGRGGLGGSGGLCGALNGAAAAIGLYCPSHEQGALVRTLVRWFQSESLPVFVSPDSDPSHLTPPSVSASSDCHVSLAQWKEAAGGGVTRDQRSERCRRLSADAAAKAVELLNGLVGDDGSRCP